VPPRQRPNSAKTKTPPEEVTVPPLPVPPPEVQPEIVAVVVDDTNSDEAIPDPFDFAPPPAAAYDATGIPSEPLPAFFEPPPEIGDAIDREVKRNRRVEEKPPKDKAKAGPPTLAEWQDFFARVVFLTVAEWYVSWAFRGVPEELIADEDLDKLTLSKEDRAQIAAPFAELANKSDIARKHGRRIIAMADSMEAVIIVGMWVSKVNRTARKYKPAKKAKVKNGSMGQAPPAPNGAGPGDFVPDENIRIYNPGTG
jgi:hypothetical protein